MTKRDISYAASAQSRAGRMMIRALENATGRLGLIRMANGYAADLAESGDFWQVMLARYGLTLDVTQGSLCNIPATGPLILVSNHPFGILDGLMMGHILAQRRGDFRILANQVFARTEALEKTILPISFDNTKAAMRLNVQTRAAALAHLQTLGAIGIFPGGTVSTSARPMAAPMDPIWRNFTAKLITKSGAAVVPIYFEGVNSHLFQIASHLHPSLRLGLLLNQFRGRIGKPVQVVVGRPIPQVNLAQHRANPKAMMDFLRKATYDLSCKPLPSLDYGFEFDEKYKV